MRKKVTETTATVGIHGEIKYEGSVIDNLEDFRFAVGEAQVIGKKAIEVSERVYTHLTLGKDTPYIIWGKPAVKVYKVGTMDRTERLESLSVEELMEIKAAKARKVAEQEKAKKRAIIDEEIK